MLYVIKDKKFNVNNKFSKYSKMNPKRVSFILKLGQKKLFVISEIIQLKMCVIYNNCAPCKVKVNLFDNSLENNIP